MFQMFDRLDAMSDGKATAIAILTPIPGAILFLFGDKHPGWILWGMAYFGAILVPRLAHLLAIRRK